ncbi:MAG: glycosyltransferase family 4 protein [Lentimicrobium sp.]|nr:glycosyltransferase family 4 protein [Lentimicrobium sp.]
MKILLLCNKSPWPPLEGGPIAMNAMVTGLTKAGHQVKVLAVNSNKYSVSEQAIPEDYRQQTGIEFTFIDLAIKPWPAFLNLFSGSSYHVDRFISHNFEDALTKILTKEKFDIIQFETLFTSPYLSLIRRLSDAKVVLRAHNIEHRIWQRIASGCYNPFRKFYLSHLTRTLRRYEIKILNEVDGIIAITGKDADFFRSVAPATPVIDIPFGINAADNNNILVPEHKQTQLTLFHLGSMNWVPNQEGIRWFTSKVWPQISRKYPELRFHLAGREMPGWLKKMKIPGIIIDGEVPDAKAYMQAHDIMIVPLFSGSGIRIKIIEGMLAGKTIITTSIGAEGIACKNDEHLLIAEDAEGFINAIEKCLKTPAIINDLGINARNLVKSAHDNVRLMQKISDFYDQIRG